MGNLPMKPEEHRALLSEMASEMHKRAQISYSDEDSVAYATVVQALAIVTAVTAGIEEQDNG